MTEFIDYSNSEDLHERIGYRVYKHETSIHKGIGEIRLLADYRASAAMSGLAVAIKDHIRLMGYATQEDVQSLLETQLDEMLGLDEPG